MTQVRRLIVAAWFTTFFLIGCPHPQAPEGPPVVPDLRGPASSAQCIGACVTLRRLGCDEGQPSPGGIACERVCENASAMLPIACVLEASTIEGVRKCGVRCQ